MNANNRIPVGVPLIGGQKQEVGWAFQPGANAIPIVLPQMINTPEGPRAVIVGGLSKLEMAACMLGGNVKLAIETLQNCHQFAQQHPHQE